MDLGSKYMTCPKCKLVIDLYKISNADVCPRCASSLPTRLVGTANNSREDEQSNIK